MPDDKTKQLEANFARVALSQLDDRLRPYAMTFQVLRRKNEDTQAVGFFSLKLGEDRWAYVPVFFVNARVRLPEILDGRRFVPATDAWVEQLLATRPSVLGAGIGSDRVHKSRPNLGVFGGSRRQFDKAAADSLADVEGGLQASDEFDLMDRLSRLPAAANALLKEAADDPEFLETFLRYHTVAELRGAVCKAEMNKYAAHRPSSGAASQVEVVTKMAEARTEQELKDIAERGVAIRDRRTKDEMAQVIRGDFLLEEVNEPGSYILYTYGDKGAVEPVKCVVAPALTSSLMSGKGAVCLCHDAAVQLDDSCKPYGTPMLAPEDKVELPVQRASSVKAGDHVRLFFNGRVYPETEVYHVMKRGGRTIWCCDVRYVPRKTPRNGVSTSYYRESVSESLSVDTCSFDRAAAKRGGYSPTHNHIILGSVDKPVVANGMLYISEDTPCMVVQPAKSDARRFIDGHDRAALYRVLENTSLLRVDVLKKASGELREIEIREGLDGGEVVKADAAHFHEAVKRLVALGMGKEAVDRVLGQGGVWLVKPAADTGESEGVVGEVDTEVQDVGGPLSVDLSVPKRIAQLPATNKRTYDTSVLAALLANNDVDDISAQFVDDMLLALDRMGRMVFQFYWQFDAFSDSYGEDDVQELESTLTGTFNQLGDLVQLVRKRVSPPYSIEL